MVRHMSFTRLAHLIVPAIIVVEGACGPCRAPRPQIDADYNLEFGDGWSDVTIDFFVLMLCREKHNVSDF